jgi:hypothetical protein
MGAALLQQPVSGDCLSGGRFIAGPVHQPGEKDPGIQIEAGLWIGRTRHVQNTPAAESAIGQWNGPELPGAQVRDRLRLERIGDRLRHQSIVPQ